MNQLHNEIKMDKKEDLQKDINYYTMQINKLIDDGKYWKATELLEKVNRFVDKNEWADKSKILYDIDLEKFLEGMCCCGAADECLSGAGGCSGCGGCLCTSVLVCYCCSGQDLGQGCDTTANCWNNCCCVDILFGKSCECG